MAMKSWQKECVFKHDDVAPAAWINLECIKLKYL